MVYVSTKNTNLVILWRPFERKMSVYFMAIWNILRTFGIFYGHLVYFMIIWNILCSFGRFLFIWYVVPRKIWQPWFAMTWVNFGRSCNGRYKCISWYILRPFDIFCSFCGHLVYFSRFGMLYQEKCGKPGHHHQHDNKNPVNPFWFLLISL
jgi:hypothetical protein